MLKRSPMAALFIEIQRNPPLYFLRISVLEH
jgi:hypothetical protein